MVAGYLAVAFEHVDFVFPIVRMQWRVAFRFKFEQAHGKIRGAIILFYQPSYFDAFSAFFLHAFKFDFRVVNAFEAQFPQTSAS